MRTMVSGEFGTFANSMSIGPKISCNNLAAPTQMIHVHSWFAATIVLKHLRGYTVGFSSRSSTKTHKAIAARCTTLAIPNQKR